MFVLSLPFWRLKLQKLACPDQLSSSAFGLAQFEGYLLPSDQVHTVRRGD